MAFNPAGRPKKLGRYELAVEVSKAPLGPGYIAVREENPRLGFLRLIDTTGLPNDALDKLSEGSWWSLDARSQNTFSARDVVLEEGQLGVVSEYVEGEPLRSLLRLSAFKKQPATLSVALAIAGDVARGVHALQTQAEPPSGPAGGSAANGNLCSDHVQIGTDGVTRLSDPGVLSAARRIERFSRLTELAQYAAPEQHRGERADARSDVFALGVIFWELLSGGKHLFIGGTAAVIAERITGRDTPRLEQGVLGKLPPQVTEVVARALRRDPSERYGAMDELLAALESLGERATPDVVGKWARDLCGTAFTLRAKQVEKALSAPISPMTSLAPRVAASSAVAPAKTPAAEAPRPPSTSARAPTPHAPSVASRAPAKAPAPQTKTAAQAQIVAPTPAASASLARPAYESVSDDLLEDLETESEYESLEMEALEPETESLEMEALEPNTEEEPADALEGHAGTTKQNEAATPATPAPSASVTSPAPTALASLPERRGTATPKSLVELDPIGTSIPPPPFRAPRTSISRSALLGVGGAALVLALGTVWLTSRSKAPIEPAPSASEKPLTATASSAKTPPAEPAKLAAAKAEAAAATPSAQPAGEPPSAAATTAPAVPSASSTTVPSTTPSAKVPAVAAPKSTSTSSASTKTTSTKSTTKSTSAKSTTTKTTSTKSTTTKLATTSKKATTTKPRTTTTASAKRR